MDINIGNKFRLNYLTASRLFTPFYEFNSKEILRALQANEDGDAWVFVELHCGKFCYDHSTNRWYTWVGHYWKEDDVDQVTASIKDVIDTYG